MQPGRPELVIEHGSTSLGRWLRRFRIRLAVGLAVLEAGLVLVGVISWWAVVLFAAAAVLFWLWAGRRLRSDAGRQLSWVAASSQALVALVPVITVVVGTVLLIGLAFLAVAALIVLFLNRP